ncbi:enoyl-CoA hydratase/isomerase family protein [Desertimonas flava]|uniref:enoyl-CoA hydratase/isomerase family protein n=1 Tax=Desertimonas flava TaxID=2064846 RepID=UPI000E34BDEA|nr:enoyl-CoA hydratase-related protein [Desertimonas flava]
MEYEQITYDVRDEVAVITLNRPDKLNAWTPRMAEEQVDAINRANDDPGVGAIVTTGAGRGFCAGADMEATFNTRISGTDPGNDTAGGVGGMPKGVDWVSLCRRSKPMVAAINGAAVGIGVTMCLPMDHIVAGPAAKLGMFFIKMGIVPELASSRLLADRVGFGHASDLCLSGRLVPAPEAKEIGLVDRLADTDEDLLETALAIAATYAANPAPQLRMIKELLTVNATEGDLIAVQQAEHRYLAECWTSPQHAEAVQAFLEKRPPVFTR